MTNEEVFRRLEDRGAVRAEVVFSGGNDEGGAEGIYLYNELGVMVGEIGGANVYRSSNGTYMRYGRDPET
ncbi:MAG: hypothetical protein M3P49_12725, partial [Actinomycetota bacterium]|nr:hypothetical protein [Actinomycetota bacterium]